MKKKVIAIIISAILISAIGTFLYFYISMKQFRVGDYEYAFVYFSGHEWYEFDYELSIEKYYGEDKDVKIPSHFLFWKTTYIENRAFEDNFYIENVIIPDTVTGIGKRAFSNCSNLKSIKFSNSLDYIDTNAFRDCTSLSEVTFPESLRIIDINAFNGCTSLKSIYIPEKVRIIGDGVFANCTNLKTVTSGEGLEEIGVDAFWNTPWLDEYEGDFVQLNNILMEYRGKDNEIDIPENIRIISSEAFANCSNIISVTGGEGLEKIESGAFEDTQWFEDYEADFVELNNILIKYKGKERAVAIPENIVSTCENAFTHTNVEEIYMNNVSEFNLYSTGYPKTSGGKTKIHFKNTEEFEATAWFIDESFIFCGSEDSLAIQYAQENGIEYIIEE